MMSDMPGNGSSGAASSAERVAVAMSGGIDSSVAAALLVDQGRDVVGVTARMWKDGSRCCSQEDIDRARRVAGALGIRHVVVNALDVFARCVADRFAAEYVRGRTPSPCVVCNQVVKFGLLLTRAVAFGCGSLATGHYARVEFKDGTYRLMTAKDVTRDQSYFLHRLSQRQLSHTRFPLGDLLKRDDVIPYAHKRGLPIESRAESRDICFAPKGRHHEVVEAFFPGAARSGPLVNTQGRRLGAHRGIHRYTVGQRRGLGVSSAEPLYVTRIDAACDTVELGRREEVLARSCIVEDIRWVAGRPPPDGRIYGVRVRYRHKAVGACLTLLADGRARLAFATPQFAVSPGQAAVVYHDDEVLGGGWITPDGGDDEAAKGTG